MKKSLIALAALSAIAGVAQAQSSVEVYGLLDMSYSEIKSSGSGTTVKLTSLGGQNSVNGTGLLQGSRLGFRGTEDLGGGLKAGFVVEYGVQLTGSEDGGTYQNSASNASAATQAAKAPLGQSVGNMRQGYVSLNSDKLGTLRLGTQYSLTDATAGEVAGTQAHGGTNNNTGAAWLFKTGASTWGRASNAIAYHSPVFNGFQAKVLFNAAENLDTTGATNVKSGESTQYALEYKAGAAQVGYSYQKVKDVAAVTSWGGFIGDANDTPTISAMGTGTNTANTTLNVLGGSYNFGVVKVGLNHATFKNELKTGAAKLESTQDSVSASYPVTAALTLNAAYTAGKFETTGVKAYDTTGLDLVAVYSLSKRTNAYVVYSEAKFDAVGSGTDVKQTQVGVGLRHSF